jgi:hypothetical protein
VRALAAILLLITACGRLAFDTRVDADGDSIRDGASPDVPDIGYFMSPTGDDAAAGTRAAPWKTFTASLPRLVPGDRLNLLDGDYDIQVVGDLEPDCTNGMQNGTSSAPITIRADHPRRAHLYDANTPLGIINCAYWTIEDLYVEGRDNMADTSGMVVSAYTSDHTTFRGLLVVHPNRAGNNYGVNIAHSTNTLVEDVEVYDYHRGAITDYDSSNTVYRRIYTNGRRAVDAGYTTYCAVGGDFGILAYYSRAGTVQDAIFEDNCDAGFSRARRARRPIGSRATTGSRTPSRWTTTRA